MAFQFTNHMDYITTYDGTHSHIISMVHGITERKIIGTGKYVFVSLHFSDSIQLSVSIEFKVRK